MIGDVGLAAWVCVKLGAAEAPDANPSKPTEKARAKLTRCMAVPLAVSVLLLGIFDSFLIQVAAFSKKPCASMRL
jgi:hypothetical protein